MTFRVAQHSERHLTGEAGWLRASVLGANDGLLSTASLVLGVAAAQGARSAILVADRVSAFALFGRRRRSAPEARRRCVLE